MGTSEEMELAAPPPWPAWERPSVAAERRRVVAQGLLAHRTAAEMAEELERLPADLRPVDCSPTAVEREVAALRDEWAKGRAAKLERLVLGLTNRLWHQVGDAERRVGALAAR